MRTTIVIMLGALSAVCGTAQDHGHLNVGASGNQLRFDNAAEFSGAYIKTLVFTGSGRFAGTYSGNITLTALHSTNLLGPDPNAAAPGAFITAEIVSVSGPAGGEFYFWETNSLDAPAIVIPAGATNANFRFDLSQAALGAGQPGGDAFGHIHGRSFGVNKPGRYLVSFRALDTSEYGPRYAPSETLSVQFQGGVNLLEIDAGSGFSRITFGAQAGYSWQLQSADTLTNPQWEDRGVPVDGDDSVQELLDDSPGAAERFYRVVGTEIEP